MEVKYEKTKCKNDNIVYYVCLSLGLALALTVGKRLEVVHIDGEDEAIIFESNDYKVLNYTPFSSNQNIKGAYPIMVQILICKATGELLKKTNETKNIRWISLTELKGLLENNKNAFYPMHVTTLTKYINRKAVTQ